MLLLTKLSLKKFLTSRRNLGVQEILAKQQIMFLCTIWRYSLGVEVAKEIV
jgi:hypothetical protein